MDLCCPHGFMPMLAHKWSCKQKVTARASERARKHTLNHKSGCIVKSKWRHSEFEMAGYQGKVLRWNNLVDSSHWVKFQSITLSAWDVSELLALRTQTSLQSDATASQASLLYRLIRVGCQVKEKTDFSVNTGHLYRIQEITSDRGGQAELDWDQTSALAF